jgi:hypothetical protein
MIRKYILEILDGNNLKRRNYFGYTKNSFSLNCFNEVSDKATEGL